MYKIIAIAGKSGAGKDTLLHEFIKTGDEELHEIVSCTTRPPRENEVDGINYHFLTSEEFTEMLYNGSMIEATVFNDWCYGTSLAHLDKNKINVGVFNPEGIGLLADSPEINLFIIYVKADGKTRLLRQLNREKNPNVDEIIRRYSTDEQDFKYFQDEFCRDDDLNWAIILNDDNFDLSCVPQNILSFVKQKLDTNH